MRLREQEHKNQITPTHDLCADLHLHTIYSDGVLTPHDLVMKAAHAGLSVISITDHDNVGAIEEAVECGKGVGVEVVPGVELSIELNDKDIHLLAYFFDYKNERMLEYLAYFRQERLRRAERIVQKLNRINIPLKMDAVLDRAGVGSVGRPHIATALVENGLIETYNEAFLKYIGTGMPAYEKKCQLSPIEAVKLIASSGGLSFLAHPGKYTSEVELLQLIDAGVDGIEVVHPSHSGPRQEFYRNLVHQYFLLESGGSDFHGGKKNDDEVFGSYTVPLQVVDEMRDRLFA
jgi:predicted metal-dependent phosphoesterase TrpH